MERLKLVPKAQYEPGPTPGPGEDPRRLEDVKAVVRHLTENAMKVLNNVTACEMSKPEPDAELVEDYYLLFHYLDYITRFVSGKV